ncbi:putative udp-galactose transporter like protein [Erysiphe neolycopersici]|uniref:Putative udp-galactose transporter like protein n=1 Tax=Erysiphe neolycopersici TaxID=212602 RepID=A0A420HIJ7_9PEZI|nr:putative udp-galactose transporter like protein [Erysiphe neolycopersici]
MNEEGLPMAEIVEMLDDMGNVISSQVYESESAKLQILEALRKAEGRNYPEYKEPLEKINHPDTIESDKKTTEKKSVSFTEDTKSDLKQDGLASKDKKMIPSGESAEDAALRQQMLQYGMLEVGAVVAELQIEDESDQSSNWSENLSDIGEASSSDQEDEYGRYTGRAVSDELRQRMIELEERLGKEVMTSLYNKPNDLEIVEEGIGRITIKDEKSETVTSNKTVRFSENLETSHPIKLPVIEQVREKTEGPKFAPISDVVERTPTLRVTSPSNNKVKSLFDNSESRSIFTESERVDHTKIEISKGPLLAPTIIERPSKLINEPDEMDPDLLRQEVATEYYKIRNMMIQRQGGFTKENESERVEFTEEEGGPKKISRFKAARVALS